MGAFVIFSIDTEITPSILRWGKHLSDIKQRHGRCTYGSRFQEPSFQEEWKMQSL